MSNHKISEAGEGLPDEGELIYNQMDSCLYEVESIDSGIQTAQWQANYVLATLSYVCEASDIGEEAFEDLRNLRVLSLPGNYRGG